MKKVKAIKTIEGRITEGKVYYCVNETSFMGFDEAYDLYKVVADNGEEVWVETEHFTDVDEPVIEVGSEWISQNGVVWTVVYSGKSIVVIHKNTENTLRREKFLERYKPKPKTVKMYFYRLGDGYVAFNHDKPFAGELLFTREIELP